MRARVLPRRPRGPAGAAAGCGGRRAAYISHVSESDPDTEGTGREIAIIRGVRPKHIRPAVYCIVYQTCMVPYAYVSP
jgi:hypothetical protein